MTEIKFRFAFKKEDESNDFIFSDSSLDDLCEYHIKAEIEEIEEKGYELIAKDQYTGVNDKNGKEGCHKDLVLMEPSSYFTIKWDDTVAKFCLQSANKLDTTKYSMIYLTNHGLIVGNTHENPEELLKP